MAGRPERRGLLRRTRRAAGTILLGWLGVSSGVVVLLRWVDPPTTAFIVADRVRAWRASEQGYRYRHRWVDWARISPSAKLAVIASEDQRFADHFGFDLVEIGHAMQERRSGRSARGASTITQQTAKNLFLWGGRSWLRKGLEAYFTVLIEAFWSKPRILEVYLNVAEFGPGVFGIGAASEHFFHRPAARLDRARSALLAAVLPNPRRLRVSAPSAHVRERQAWILEQMSALGGERYLSELGGGRRGR